MNVLVTAASDHGSTAEIASAIAETLKKRGLAVTVAPVEEVQSGRVVGSRPVVDVALESRLLRVPWPHPDPLASRTQLPPRFLAL